MVAAESSGYNLFFIRDDVIPESVFYGINDVKMKTYKFDDIHLKKYGHLLLLNFINYFRYIINTCQWQSYTL